MSSGAQPKPIEARFQDDFYRCFNKTAGRGMPACTEWSRPQTAESVSGFRPEVGSGVCSRTDRTNEHIMRFHRNGRYYPWRIDGMIQDWINVHCTTSPPKRGYEETQLIDAIFKKDYAISEILDNQMEILQTSFVQLKLWCFLGYGRKGMW
ncbi:hypothetical protein BDW67DRAFT_58558 [Aspergillus spinulosporus]